MDTVDSEVDDGEGVVVDIVVVDKDVVDKSAVLGGGILVVDGCGRGVEQEELWEVLNIVVALALVLEKWVDRGTVATLVVGVFLLDVAGGA